MVDDRWKDSEAAQFTTLLDQRVYTSRLLGSDPELVMHGGGNTSVKDKVKNLLGEEESVLFIKGSGWDLGSIERPGFPGVRLSPLLQLKQLKTLTDPDMVNFLRTNLIQSPAPDPSVETLLHAFLPFTFIDHTHADAVLTLTNQPNAESILKEIYGDEVGLVPYIMPGFLLSKECFRVFESNPKVKGLILLKHGVLTFGETAKESYQRMISIVQKAEGFIARHVKPRKKMTTPSTVKMSAVWMQTIRSEYLKRGFRSVLILDESPEAVDFVSLPETANLSQRGPITPDHIIRTKRLPLYVTSSSPEPTDFANLLNGYGEAYRKYFEEGQARRTEKKTMLDTLPRVILIPKVGIVTVGRTFKDARIAMDIYEHTFRILENAEQVGSYEALSADDLFEMEYWVLEQAKLALLPKSLPLTGRVAVVTGGASGIGLAITQEFLAQGAVVHVLDLNDDALSKLRTNLKPFIKSGNQVFTHVVDLTSREKVAHAVSNVVRYNGGIDIAVLNAGIFPRSNSLDEITSDDWLKSLNVNLNGSFNLLTEVLPWMKHQQSGGDIIFIGSKNVTAPGPQAGAYSVAKAAQIQLARVCALENGRYGIRVNTLHPHLIFDTGIWSDEIIAKRAAAYGLTPEAYKKNNLLKVELSSKDVGKAAFALVAGYFGKTTGAQIPVDGGSDRTL